MNTKIKIKEIPEIDLAFIKCTGSNNVTGAFYKLIKWSKQKNILNENSKLIRIFHDSFKFTDASKVRMSICITLNKTPEINNEIGLTKIKKGKFIVGSFEIGLDEFEKYWTEMFIWMNKNGYKKSNREPFEIYHNNYKNHPENKSIVDFYIPII